jgi:Fur family ferric uptake transcriptional regulator
MEEKGTKSPGIATERPDPVLSLRKKGLRVTAQRELIMRVFSELPNGMHLSAEELHGKLNEQDSNVSLATAYRTLNLLTTLGLLRELYLAEGHKHYELKLENVPHQHIVCLKCNSTVEFEDFRIEEAGKQIGAKHNFKVIDAQFKISGICQNCCAETLTD